MRPFQLTALLLISCSFASAQNAPQWSRVYTFDESIIEMNSAKVVLGGDIGRVTFRWIFDQPEPLPGKPTAKYQTRLENVEFKCADNLYRYYDVTFLDSSGMTLSSELMRSPYAWHQIKPGSVIATMSIPACELINRNLDPDTARALEEDRIESAKVGRFVSSVRRTLEQSLDFRQIVDKFFVSDFISRYLNDSDRNWFDNLDRELASKTNHEDLQRFYIASMNAGYLTSLYVIGKSPSDSDTTDNERVPEEKMVPPDVYRLIDAHPYTHKYKRGQGAGYDFLAERITNVDQLRSYTDLLEKIAGLMRKHVIDSHSIGSKLYAEMSADSNLDSSVCPGICLGLPKGTEVDDLILPAMHLRFAKIQGQFKIVSAIDASQ